MFGIKKFMTRREALDVISIVTFDQQNPLQELSKGLQGIYNNISINSEEKIFINGILNSIEDAKYITTIEDRKERFFALKQEISKFFIERPWEGI